jgi:hypothetical protein
MLSYEQLIASRKEWIETVLRPWCREAKLKDLKRAGQEWQDIAGKVAPEMTLWTWAWERFPALVHEGLTGVNETAEVTVTLKDGRRITGFPDGRKSVQGKLVLLSSESGEEQGPFAIDEVESVEAVS